MVIYIAVPIYSQRPQRISSDGKSSLWNQEEAAFLQRANQETPTHWRPGVPRREHAHDVEPQAASATRHSGSRYQWVWNLRLSPLDRRCRASRCATPSWAPSKAAPAVFVAEEPSPEEYGPWQWAAAFGRATGRFGAEDFVLQEDGELRCPSGAS